MKDIRNTIVNECIEDIDKITNAISKDVARTIEKEALSKGILL